MRHFKSSDFLVVRWLAIAGAAGAALAQVVAYFTENSPMVTRIISAAGFVAALLAIAGVAAMVRGIRQRNEAMEEVVQESTEQQKVMGALQRELEIHKNLERELVEAKKAAEASLSASCRREAARHSPAIAASAISTATKATVFQYGRWV